MHDVRETNAKFANYENDVTVGTKLHLATRAANER